MLTEPIFAYLRLTDSNRPTASVIIYYWLKIISICDAWKKEKFKRVDDEDSFARAEFTMLSQQETKASGLGSDHAWTSSEMANYRWDLMF